MAKAAVLSLNLALVLSLLLMSMAEGRLVALGFGKAEPAPRTPSCEAVYGVESGETCFLVQKQFNLTPEEFAAINPNLVCETLFVGQWLCVSGSA